MLLPGEQAAEVTSPEAIIRLIAPFQAITAADIRRAAVYVAHQRVALNYRAGRVLLAGDAAHMMPPFAGQALNAGIRDVANLAWKLAANIHGTGTDALIDTYQTERRPHAVDMVRLSLRIGQVVMNVNPVLTAIRDAAITASGIIPAAKGWLAGMKFLKQPHFNGGCVADPRHGRPEECRRRPGGLLPVPAPGHPGHRRHRSAGRGSGYRLGTAVLPVRAQRPMEVRRVDAAGNGTATTSDGGAPLALSAATPVTDASGAFAALAGSGVTLLVRPDRYVAAAMTAATRQATLDALAAYVPALAGLEHAEAGLQATR